MFNSKKSTTKVYETTNAADNGSFIDNSNIDYKISGSGTLNVTDGGAFDLAGQSVASSQESLLAALGFAENVELLRSNELSDYRDNIFDAAQSIQSRSVAAVDQAYRTANGTFDSQWLLYGGLAIFGLLAVRALK